MIETQRDRFAEFLARADAVNSLLNERLVPVLPRVERLVDVARSAPTVGKKIHWIRRGADALGDALAGISACGAGCAHCCAQPVMLLASEARTIGREIGVAVTDVPHERRNAEPPRWRGEGHECPFLRDGRCSIYAVRPLPCRLLFNLDKDARLCVHEEEPSQVPYADLRQFEVISTAILYKDGNYVAELREFFPQVP